MEPRMTDKTPVQEKPQNELRDISIRTACLDFAIKSNCGQSYDTEGRTQVYHDDILKAAKEFEAFVRGESKEPFIEGISNHPK